MKGVILLSLVIRYIIGAFSQSFLGWTTKQVNLRAGPSTDYEVIRSLNPGSQIFIVLLGKEEGFNNIIDFETDQERNVYHESVEIGEVEMKSKGGLFSPSGATTSYNSESKVFNNTTRTLKLKLNSQADSFLPQKRKTMTHSPGEYSIKLPLYVLFPILVYNT